MRGFLLSLAGIPLSVQWKMVDGVSTRVLIAGTEAARPLPPLVLVHGTAAHAEGFIRNIGPFAAATQVIAYDLPAHGWSDTPDRSYEIEAYCSHLAALLERLEVGRATLCGHSLGAWIVSRFTALNPSVVDKAILISPAGTVTNEASMKTFREVSEAVVAHPSQGTVRRRLELLVADPSSITDELCEFREYIYNQPDAAIRMDRILCLQDPEVRSRNLLTPSELRKISCPALVLTGDKDVIVPVKAAERVARLIPDGRLDVIQSCGHWPQFERATDVNRRILAFLRSEESSGLLPLLR